MGKFTFLMMIGVLTASISYGQITPDINTLTGTWRSKYLELNKGFLREKTLVVNPPHFTFTIKRYPKNQKQPFSEQVMQGTISVSPNKINSRNLNMDLTLDSHTYKIFEAPKQKFPNKQCSQVNTPIDLMKVSCDDMGIFLGVKKLYQIVYFQDENTILHGFGAGAQPTQANMRSTFVSTYELVKQNAEKK